MRALLRTIRAAVSYRARRRVALQRMGLASIHDGLCRCRSCKPGLPRAHAWAPLQLERN